MSGSAFAVTHHAFSSGAGRTSDGNGSHASTALSVDEYFWRHILHRGHQQVLFVVTQADKTEPCHEWDMAGIQPSPAQAQNIREKTEAVFRLFRPVHPVVAVSVRTGWELDTLVSALMTALPDHAASPLMTRLQDELRTESCQQRQSGW